MTKEELLSLLRVCGADPSAIDAVELAFEAGMKEARGACAALLEDNAMACNDPIHRSLLQSNAEAIRAMGQKPKGENDD